MSELSGDRCLIVSYYEVDDSSMCIRHIRHMVGPVRDGGIRHARRGGLELGSCCIIFVTVTNDSPNLSQRLVIMYIYIMRRL